MQQWKKAIWARASDGAHYPITGMMCTVLLLLKSGQLIANQIWEFCYSYDYGLIYIYKFLLPISLVSHKDEN